MSFSKARLQRFNDIKDCTPSPATYNVPNKDKLKYGTIDKAAKSLKKSGTPPGSEAGSVHSTPCFQTPTVPKKKKILGLSFRSGKSHDVEELREKIVECSNKDMYIRELIEQIEDMKEKMNSLECEKRHFQEKFLHHTKECNRISVNVTAANRELCETRKFFDDLRDQHTIDLQNVSTWIAKFPEFCDKISLEAQEREDRHAQEIAVLKEQLLESQAKFKLLEENFNEINLLKEIQTKELVEDVEASWKAKLQGKEKEAEAILKECQAISEYNIIQSEIEKNSYKSQFLEISTKFDKLQEETLNFKSEKHAYELSITTFKETIEVLKKRLIDSDRDVIQLKEEVEKCEEKNLFYEKKCCELSDQLKEVQNANEELEMQYESTSRILQNQIGAMEKELLGKVDLLKTQSQVKAEDNKRLRELADEQHLALVRAEETISHSVEHLDELHILNTSLEAHLDEERGLRKKYLETSEKYNELAQQFEQLLQELDVSKGRIDELETSLEMHKSKIHMLDAEKQELGEKYAEILGHQNHEQKIKHLKDLKMKTSELFEKNVDLESKNLKLNKVIEKLKKELDDLKKTGKRGVDKENVGSPKCIKTVLSPGPLKAKN